MNGTFHPVFFLLWFAVLYTEYKEWKQLSAGPKLTYASIFTMITGVYILSFFTMTPSMPVDWLIATIGEYTDYLFDSWGGDKT